MEDSDRDCNEDLMDKDTDDPELEFEDIEGNQDHQTINEAEGLPCIVIQSVVCNR
jgi:hypothetical protein